MGKIEYLLLFTVVLTCAGCSDTHKSSISVTETPATATPSPVKKEIPAVSPSKAPGPPSTIDFNIDSYKGTEDYKFIQVAYKNMMASVKKDQKAFAETFLPDVESSAYENVMEQDVHYKKIELVIKQPDQVSIVVRYERPSTYQPPKMEATNRVYVLQQNDVNEWLVYMID